MAAAAPVAVAMQAVGGLMQGIEGNRAQRAQAKVDEENARLTQLEGEQQVLQTQKDERMLAGEMLAGMAGGGAQIGTGTTADLLAESAYQRELETLNIRTRATREAEDLRRQASERRKAGRAALIGGVFGAAASALEGVADMRRQRTASQRAEQDRAPRRPPPMRLATGVR